MEVVLVGGFDRGCAALAGLQELLIVAIQTGIASVGMVQTAWLVRFILAATMLRAESFSPEVRGTFS